MKTFTRMIRRYVLATAAVVLLVVGLLLGLTVYLGLHYGETSDDRARIGTLAEALTPTADGLQFDPAQTPAQWMQGYAWAMVLDGNGTVIWQYDLPQNLNKHYTASEIASFSRWYLDDWPVFCWTADYGLFVAAQPRGSVWKYNIYSSAALMYAERFGQGGFLAQGCPADEREQAPAAPQARYLPQGSQLPGLQPQPHPRGVGARIQFLLFSDACFLLSSFISPLICKNPPVLLHCAATGGFLRLGCREVDNVRNFLVWMAIFVDWINGCQVFILK